MKKTLYAALLVLGINTIASEVVTQSETNIDIRPNNEMKLLLDCSHKSKTFFGNKVYSEDSNVNDFMIYICRSSLNEKYLTNYKVLSKDINNYAFENNLSWGYEYFGTKDNPRAYDKHSRYVKKQQINDFQTNKLKYEFTIYKRNYFSNDIEMTFKLPVVSLNTDFLVIYDFNMSEVLKPIEEKNFLKYEYDLTNDSIKKFEIANPIKVDFQKHFTDTYNIDNINECINGEIWVKKYGAKSRLTCNYIEILR